MPCVLGPLGDLGRNAGEVLSYPKAVWTEGDEGTTCSGETGHLLNVKIRD